ncbi:MAG: pyruvate kinase [Planctomycetota bacterium]
MATIGTPDIYKDNHIVDIKGEEVEENRITWEYLVEKFFENGADIIRLNCSHIDLKDVGNVFREIKRAILQCEQKNNQQKRMAVLADLPGPKIRFDIKNPISVSVGSEFTILFDEEVSEASTQTVYIDKVPLKKALDKADDVWEQRSSCPPDVEGCFAENVLGFPGGVRNVGRRFSSFMNKVYEKLHEGKRLLVFVGDGDVVMEVVRDEFNLNTARLKCKIVSVKENKIKGHKGFTLKGIDIDMPTFTSTDTKLLKELLKADMDKNIQPNEPVMAFVALSFVQTADDVLRAREFIENILRGPLGEAARHGAPSIVAKLETGKGWRNRDFILDIADGAMVARGDLGLQMEIEEVPRMQKQLIELCNKRGKPIITATEMLKSMTRSIEPTRAEGSDVFNAIQDGTDAVMTSEETSNGKYPFHTLRKMVSIAEKAELHVEMYEESEEKEIEINELKKSLKHQRLVDFLKDDWARIEENKKRLDGAFRALNRHIAELIHSDTAGQSEQLTKSLNWRISLYQEKFGKTSRQETTNRITQAACMLTETTGTKAIFAASASGRTARMISRLRPSVPIIGAAHDLMNMRKMIISFGVFPICIGKVSTSGSTDNMFEIFKEVVLKHTYLREFFVNNDTLIFTAGTPLQTPGTTNLVQIKRI